MYDVPLPRRGVEGMKERRLIREWLVEEYGERIHNGGTRWDFRFRHEGGITYEFVDLDDALKFKLVWG